MRYWFGGVFLPLNLNVSLFLPLASAISWRGDDSHSSKQ